MTKKHKYALKVTLLRAKLRPGPTREGDYVNRVLQVTLLSQIVSEQNKLFHIIIRVGVRRSRS